MAFYAVYDRIAPAQNKYMATLFVTSATRMAVVDRVYRFNWQAAAVTGVMLEQELRFITARTVGTAFTIQQEDTTVALSAGITADFASTGVTEATGSRGLVRRLFAGSEEQALAVAWNVTAAPALLNDAQLIYFRRPGSAGLVLRQNQGLTVKNLTNSTVGTVSYVFEFRDEAAV